MGVPPIPERVAVIGARTHRQGTGPFIARELQRNGCQVCAIAGTRKSTAEAARRHLKHTYGIACHAYTSVSALLAREAVEVLAICSPAETHLKYLHLALDAGCHVLCEKPLWWPSESGIQTNPAAPRNVVPRLRKVVLDFCQTGRYLAVNTQWPHTLPAYHTLHPPAASEPRPPAHFAMWLAPRSRGLQMVIDAAPHLLSMVRALVGPGLIESIKAEWQGSTLDQDLRMQFDYRHRRGHSLVELSLSHCLEPPRPAGYSIDGRPAQRRIELPHYGMHLEYNGSKVALPDPLGASVTAFVGAVRKGERTDPTTLLDPMIQLEQLVAAARTKASK